MKCCNHERFYTFNVRISEPTKKIFKFILKKKESCFQTVLVKPSK